MFWAMSEVHLPRRARHTYLHALPEIPEMLPAAFMARSVLGLLALDAEIDVGHEPEPLVGDRLLALDAESEALRILLETRERRHHPSQGPRAILVPRRGDRLRHLGERLRVLVVADRRRVAPGGPRPFSRWLTVLGTLVIAAALLGGLAVKRKSVVDTRAGEPLAAFDTLIRREPLDEPLADPVAADAERALDALLAESSSAAATRHGVRARLAVVLGERG